MDGSETEASAASPECLRWHGLLRAACGAATAKRCGAVAMGLSDLDHQRYCVSGPRHDARRRRCVRHLAAEGGYFSGPPRR